MDTKDRKILHELSKNARIPLNQLSKKIKLSSGATLNRLNRLEKEGILLGTLTLINTYKLGYSGFRVYLSLTCASQVKEKEILDWLVKRAETSVIGLTQNFGEMTLMSWVRSPNEFYNFIQTFKSKYREYIGEFDIFPYIGTIYYPRNYLYPEDSGKEKEVRFSDAAKHDDLDISILKLLAYDARKSALEIAKELKKPSKTIVNRIRRLENQKIIVGYSANIHINKIGYEYYKLNLIFSKSVNYGKLLSYAQQLQNSVYVDEAIGRYDFELNIEVKDKTELNKIINELRDLTGGIKSLEIKQLHKYIKLGFLA